MYRMEPPSRIPLAIVKQTSWFETTPLLEYYPIERVKALIASDFLRVDWIANRYGVIKNYENEKHQLQEFLKTYNKKEEGFVVHYRKPKHKWGRAIVKDALGCTAFSKKVRNTLIQGLYKDFDLKNCQPDVVRNICQKNNIKCPIITEYCNNRNTILEEIASKYNTTKKNAKKLILRLCFFGTFKGWREELKIEGDETPFITEFKKELCTIAEQMKKFNPELFETARQLKEAKQEKNFIGSMFALYLQEYEYRIVSRVMNHLIENTTLMKHPKNKSVKSVGIYEYDGIKLLEENINNFNKTDDEICQLLNDITLQTSGFELEWEVKEIEDVYDIAPILQKMKEEAETEQQNEDGVEEKIEIDYDRLKTFEKISKDFEKTHCKIVNKSIFIKELPDEIIPMSKTQIRTSYEHLVYERVVNDQVRKCNFIDDWLHSNSEQRCKVDMGIYPHGVECPENHFNLWRPFAMELITHYEPKPEGL
jgi:hypothetical protein